MIRDDPGRGMMRAVGNRLGIGSLEMEREVSRFPVRMMCFWIWVCKLLQLLVKLLPWCYGCSGCYGLFQEGQSCSRLKIRHSVKSRSVLPSIACFDIESGVISNEKSGDMNVRLGGSRKNALGEQPFLKSAPRLGNDCHHIILMKRMKRMKRMMRMMMMMMMMMMVVVVVMMVMVVTTTIRIRIIVTTMAIYQWY